MHVHMYTYTYIPLFITHNHACAEFVHTCIYSVTLQQEGGTAAAVTTSKDSRKNRVTTECPVEEADGDAQVRNGTLKWRYATTVLSKCAHAYTCMHVYIYMAMY